MNRQTWAVISIAILAAIVLEIVAGVEGWLSVVKAQSAALRVEVTMVTVGVRVTDKRGSHIPGLNEEDFSLFEDDERQTISFFSEEEQPISLNLALDKSLSMRKGAKLQRSKVAALSFLDSMPKELKSEFQFIVFDDKVELPLPFTTDVEAVKMQITGTTLGGGTSLYDAILTGLRGLRIASYPRQALVVITDGADQHSASDLKEVIRGLQGSQVQLYLVGYFSAQEMNLFRRRGRMVRLIDGQEIDNPLIVFARLAQESGASAFFPRSDDELRKSVEAISLDLRRQYTLGYYPPESDDLEKYRRIKVKVRGSSEVRARHGYRFPGS